LIDDHINFTLGRQAFHLADLDKAVDYFLKLLHGSKQSANQQSAYMKEFLYIYRVILNCLFISYIFIHLFIFII